LHSQTVIREGRIALEVAEVVCNPKFCLPLHQAMWFMKHSQSAACCFLEVSKVRRVAVNNNLARVYNLKERFPAFCNYLAGIKQQQVGS